jgi:hypothetical protein
MNKPKNDRDDNPAQARSDATPDVVAGVRERSDRMRGQGSDANGIPEFDEVEGEQRKRLYEETGSPIVSKID